MNFSIDTFNEKEIRINQTKLYICNENQAKLIYESLHSMKIKGIAGSINGKVIEVINVKIKDKKYFYEVKFAGESVGWISLENSPRVYRIPKQTGKIINDNLFYLNDGLKNDNSDFLNKLVDARYFFEYQNEKYILINRLGKKHHLVPVLVEDFNKYNVPDKGTTCTLSAGTELFKYSTFQEKVTKLEEDSNVEVLGYFEGLEEMKIKLDGKIFWVKYKIEIEEINENVRVPSPEMIDKIMYLKLLATNQEQELESQRRKIQVIRDNIEINNDLQKLYLTKYLGDANDFE